MKLLYDVQNNKWYNENGESFSSENPAIPYGNSERVVIQLYSEVKGTNSGSEAVADWKKYTGFTGSGYGAILATDNNFLHWYKAKLATMLAAGTIAPGTPIEVTTTESVNNISPAGNIYLYDDDGNNEAIAYSSREAINGGIRFVAAEGNVLENSYAVNDQSDIPEMLYAEAVMVAAASDPATGLFAFDFVCDSAKLRDKMQYSSIEKVDDCKGLELTVFQTQENNIVSIRKRFRCTTFRITGGIADIKTGVPVPFQEEDRIIALLNSYVSQGMDLQCSVDKITWVNYADVVDFQAQRWFRIRIKNSVVWSDAIPLIVGAAGRDGVDGRDGEDGAIITGAGVIRISVSGNTANCYNEISGGTTTLAISGGTSIVFPQSFLAANGNCEYDLIDANGKNITADPTLTRQWTENGYVVTLSGGWDGDYELKPHGIKGDGAAYTSSDTIEFVGGTSPTANVKLYDESPIYVKYAGETFSGLDIRLDAGLKTIHVDDRHYLSLDIESTIFGGTSSLADDHTKLLLGSNYTAFEVLANDELIPAGSSEYLGVSLAVTISEVEYTTAVDIPVGMEHEFKAWVINGDGVTVDWGDGTTEEFSAVDSIATCNHTYEEPGKYLVKVYGDFVRTITTSSKNLIYRILDEGLPLASHHTSLQGFAQGALRLVAVDAPSWGKCPQIESLLNTFTGCKNLRSVSGMARIPHLVSASGAFKDCHAMVSCDFRLPPVMLNIPGTGDAYRGVFYSSSNVGFSLSGDVSKFFPDGGFAADFVDLTQLFYNYRSDIRYPNLTLTDANAAKLARILWGSGKKFVYRSSSDEVGGSSGIFRCFPAAVRAKIPVLWGGTNEEIEIDPATGSVPAVEEYITATDSAFTVTGGTLSLHIASRSTDYIYVDSSGGVEINKTNITEYGLRDLDDDIFEDIVIDRIKTAIGGTATLYEAGTAVVLSGNTIGVRVLAGGGYTNIAETLWSDFEFCASVVQKIKADILPSDYFLYDAGYGIKISGATISFSDALAAAYNEKYINIGGGATNAHPDSTLVIGSNTVTSAAKNSVVCGGSNYCENSYSFMFGYQLQSSQVQFQMVVGRSNKRDTDAYFIVGNGTSSTVRNNAFTVKKNGNGVFGGDVLCNGGTVSMLDILARVEALEAQVVALGGTITQ